jgi:hypothetical protein
MSPSSPSSNSTTSRLDTTPSSSLLGTDEAGHERSKCGSDCSAVISTECSAETTPPLQLSFSDCETSAPTSKAFAPLSAEQLEAKIAPVGKRCYTCERVLPIECFARIRNKANPGREFRHSRCNQCRAKQNSGTPRVMKNREHVRKLKEQPCVDCGQRFPASCMEFSHTRGEHLFNIPEGIAYKSFSALVAELEKKDLVCANCRRLRTAQKRRDNMPSRCVAGRKPKFLAEVRPDTTEVRPGHRNPWRLLRGV